MNCRSVRASLVDLWDQADALQGNDLLYKHLQQCDSCQQISAEYSLSHQLLQGLPEEEPSENFDWRLRLRLNHVDKAAELPQVATVQDRSRWSLQFVGSAAAAAIVVMAVGFVVLQPSAPGLPDGAALPQSVVQETPQQPESSPAPALQWASQRPGLPNLAPTHPQFLKIVPVSAGVPLCPDPMAQPAPSILGEAIVAPRTLLR